MISKITAIIMAIISIVSGAGIKLSTNAAFYSDIPYGSHERQVMDISFPKTEGKRVGAVLYIHGGGWVSGDKKAFLSVSKKATKDHGVISATMNYRYASKSVDCDDILDDIDAALEKIKSMAAARGLKCDKVMLVGTSAGAHLAMLYCYTKKLIAPIKPVAVVSYSGPVDLSDPKFVNDNSLGDPSGIRRILSYLIGETVTEANFTDKKSVLLEYSPTSYVSSACVPTIIAQGTKDTIVNVTTVRSFVKKLKANGVKYHYYELPNSGHSLGSDKALLNDAQFMVDDYIRKTVA